MGSHRHEILLCADISIVYSKHSSDIFGLIQETRILKFSRTAANAMRQLLVAIFTLTSLPPLFITSQYSDQSRREVFVGYLHNE